MPHFMIRKTQPRRSKQFFNEQPQVGKRFFYHLDDSGAIVNDNTIVNYETSLSLSKTQFEKLIEDMTGSASPTAATAKYAYHREKSDKLIEKTFFTDAGYLAENIGDYSMAAIAIATNYGADESSTNGNVMVIFEKPSALGAPINEVCVEAQHLYTATISSARLYI